MLISICLVIITNSKWVLNGYFAVYKYESTAWNNRYNYKDVKDNIFYTYLDFYIRKTLIQELISNYNKTF